MNSAKQEVRQLLERLPDDASFEDIQYHIYVCQKVERGLEDAEQGKTMTQEDVEQRVAQWFEK